MLTNSPNFRQLARESLTPAKAQLAENDPYQLRYAALELRYAMEALTYDRARAFEEYIPPEKYGTWQPKELVKVLAEIDPSIGRSSTFAYRLEEEDGKPTPRENMKLLGTDHVVTLKDLKTHYDAVRSYLHMPSLKQVKSGKSPNLSKLRVRREAVVEVLEKVLSSKVWNVTLGVFVSLDECMNDECKKPIYKRMPKGKDTLETQCFECGAEYTVEAKQDGDVIWTPKKKDIWCWTPNCPEKKALWLHQIKPGIDWRCRGCGARYEISLRVSEIKSDNTTPA